jgi:hypothetical protein
MKITISKAAQLYFVLLELGNKELSFTAAYRVKRNIDHLKSIGEKFLEEVKAHGGTAIEADQATFVKWEDSGETEELDLKVLDLEKEDIKLTARQIGVLEPLLTEPT